MAQAIVSTSPAPLAPAGETASTVLAAQAKALVSARFEIALAKPRDLDDIRSRLLRECQRPSFAAVAIYHKPIGEGVEGPSIRFAEAAIQAMRNLAVDTPVIYDDAEKRIIRVTVSDMETNVTHSKDVTVLKRVERSSLRDGQVPISSRTNSRGRTTYLVSASDEEMLNTENALVSKALRTTGLRLVPGWLIDECMEAVRSVRANEDAKDPDAARRKVFDAFGALGVSVDALRQWLAHDGPPQPAELAELKGIYVALKDGEVTWKDVMDARWEKTVDAMAPDAVATRTAGVKEKLKKAQEKATAPRQPAHAPAAAPQPDDDPEPGSNG